MMIKENEPLEKYTTFRMGGNAKKMYFPETVDELCDLIKSDDNILSHVIGGGSNILINDQKEYEHVLCLKNFNKKMVAFGNGHYYVGSSVSLQKLIKTIQTDGYGGIEYLFSVPGLTGGAIYMNAGRGKKYGKCISDYLTEVEVLRHGEICRIDKTSCCFSYRTSIFQNMPDCIILGAKFKFPQVSRKESEMRIQERIHLCKKNQDMTSPNFGTVFCESNKYIMAFVKKFHPGYKNGCTFSAKTANWMLRGKNGTFEQAISLLNKVRRWHCLFGQKCRTEVRIWS